MRLLSVSAFWKSHSSVRHGDWRWSGKHLNGTSEYSMYTNNLEGLDELLVHPLLLLHHHADSLHELCKNAVQVSDEGGLAMATFAFYLVCAAKRFGDS